MLRMYVLHAWRNDSCSKHDDTFKRVCIPKFMDGMPTFFLSFLPLFLLLSFFHFLLYLLKLSLGYTHTLTHIFIYSHMRDGTKKGDEKLANRNYASHMGEDRGIHTSRECTFYRDRRKIVTVLFKTPVLLTKCSVNYLYSGCTAIHRLVLEIQLSALYRIVHIHRNGEDRNRSSSSSSSFFSFSFSSFLFFDVVVFLDDSFLFFILNYLTRSLSFLADAILYDRNETPVITWKKHR